MTKQIKIGSVTVGGGAPVTIQSMCNTNTADVEATVEQIHRLEEAGCQIVRVAVPDQAAAAAVGRIRSRIHVPLVADIHFDYKLALQCVDSGIDKIRINPGNIGAEDRVKAVADACRKTISPSASASTGKPGEAVAAQIRRCDCRSFGGKRVWSCGAVK